MLNRFATFGTLFLLVASVVSGQEAPSMKAAGSSPKDTCSISGLVVKSGTSEPLKKAVIYLQKDGDPGSGYSTRTNDAGRFAIDKIDPGRYSLVVYRTGYVLQHYGERSSENRGAILTLTPGHEVQDLLFRLIPWAVISGRIVDENGEPVPDVSVEALRYFSKAGKRTLYIANHAQTNDLGEYRLYGITKGRYLVRAQIRWGGQMSFMTSEVSRAGSSPETGYAPMYYPGTSDEMRASLIEIGSGQEVPAVDFTLIPVRAVKVRGHVYDSALGQLSRECIVFLTHRDPSMNGLFSLQGEMDCQKGSFEFSDVTPGSYSIVAMSAGSEKERSAHAALEVDTGGLGDVALTLVPGIDLPGRVFVEGREPFDFAGKFVWLNDPEQHMRSTPVGNIRPDGTLTIENLQEGNYEVSVNGQRDGSMVDFYLKSARANGDDVLEKGLIVGPGASRGPLEIVISSAAARIEGTVTDDNDLPSAGAIVALIPERSRRQQFRLYKDATTDQYGKFVIRGVAPGQYKLFSWRDVETDAWQDPDFLKPFENLGTEITAEENGHLSLTLKVIPTEKPKN